RLTKDGRLIPISLTVSPVKDRAGRVIGASKVARDISERRRLESEREDLLRRAQSARAAAQMANQAKDEFLAMLSHELRNPVGVIANALAVLDEVREVRPQLVRARNVLRGQVSHLSRLLDDLLDVARMTSGRIDLAREPVDLRAAIEQAVEREQFHVDAK